MWNQKVNKKFAVIGNSQAGALANIIKQSSCDLELVPVATVHKLDKSKPELFLNILSSVDIIIHQPIGDNFGSLSIERIKEVFPHKTYISFPSVYFDGYFPNLMYLRKPGGGTLAGLIEDYHDRRLVEASLKGMTPEEAVEYILFCESQCDVRNEIERSLANLSNRGAI